MGTVVPPFLKIVKKKVKLTKVGKKCQSLLTSHKYLRSSQHTSSLDSIPSLLLFHLSAVTSIPYVKVWRIE